MEIARLRIHVVLMFFGLIFALSLPFWLLDYTKVTLFPKLPLSALGVVVPLLAALLIMKRSFPGDQVTVLVRRLLGSATTPPGRAVLFIAIPPLTALCTYYGMRSRGVVLPAIQWDASLLLFAVLAFPAALAEECGWAGFASAVLLPRMGALKSGFIIGLVWALWHVIPLLGVGREWSWILAWAVGTIFQRIVICQLLQESAVSTLWAAIFHMMANLAWQAFPVHGSYWDPFYFAPLTVAIAALLFVIKQQTSWLA